MSLCYRRHPYFYRSGIRNIRVQKLQDKKNDDFFFFCFLFCFFFICWGGHLRCLRVTLREILRSNWQLLNSLLPKKRFLKLVEPFPGHNPITKSHNCPNPCWPVWLNRAHLSMVLKISSPGTSLMSKMSLAVENYDLTQGRISEEV